MLSGKVVRVGDISTVGAKQLKLAEITFADSTGIVVVDIRYKIYGNSIFQ